ncbi:MAG: hypothetical protein Q7T50_02370, partial [Candidatus Magasanikbacteria bacterium]|nr:hypothetical protein [Candidatus Magasanikbacteria bacterium]
MKVLSTIPPYAPYLDKIVKCPNFSGFRLNTVMPIKETLEELLERLKVVVGSSPIWIDLKCRQLRTVKGVFYNS